MTRQRVIGMSAVLIIILAAAAVVWLTARPVVLPPTDSRQDEMAGMDMPGMGKEQQKKLAPVEEAVGPATPLESEGVPGIVTIAPERLQTIGVKYGQVTRRPLEKQIRTVGEWPSTSEAAQKSRSSFTGGSKSCSSARSGIM